ncbi:MAG: MBL fold metallo-hydrolase [Candidatus Rokuibacteriota bacterium]
MSTAVTFLGASGFEIVGPRHRILVDAFLTENPKAHVGVDDLEVPEVVLVTHAARDHYGDAAAIALRTGAPVVCGPDVRLMLLDEGVPAEQIRATMWGICVEVGGLHVRPVENRHFSLARLKDGQYVTGQPLAFVFETEPGVRFYHSGDSAYFDMRPIGELYRPTVGLIGCSVPEELLHWVPGAGRLVSGEMDAEEAARVAEMLGVRVAVGHHYLEPDAEAGRFLELVPQHDTTGERVALTPRIGESFVYDGAEIDLAESRT